MKSEFLPALLLLGALAARAGEPVQPAPSGTTAQPASAGSPRGESRYEQKRSAAASHLAIAEDHYGPAAAEIIGPLIALANATLEAGNTAEADYLLRRANELLDQHPDHDRSLRLAVLVLESESLVRQGNLPASTAVLYKALSLARSTSTIGPLEQADVLDRLAANEGRRGLLIPAGSFSKEALRLRRKHYGKDSLDYAGALLATANWYRFSAQFARERDLENEALVILDSQYGHMDPRLTVPLIRIATSYMAQRAHAGEAERVLQRAAGLAFSSSQVDSIDKAEALASLGDLRVVFGKPEDSTAIYAAAWEVIAAHPQLGAPAANAYFGKVRRLFVATPTEIANIGAISLVFTVTPLGAVDVARITENNVPSSGADLFRDGRSEAGAAAWHAMKASRYRPRVIDGVAVATPDVDFSLEFCIDATGAMPTCKGKGDVSAVR